MRKMKTIESKELIMAIEELEKEPISEEIDR